MGLFFNWITFVYTNTYITLSHSTCNVNGKTRIVWIIVLISCKHSLYRLFMIIVFITFLFVLGTTIDKYSPEKWKSTKHTHIESEHSLPGQGCFNSEHAFITKIFTGNSLSRFIAYKPARIVYVCLYWYYSFHTPPSLSVRTLLSS